MTRLDLREHVAEPANLWIRHSFSRWSAPAVDGRLCCDLAAGGLLSAGAAPAPAVSDVWRLVRKAADVVYVPPLPADGEPLRAAIVEAANASGAPLLLQVVADDVVTAAAAGWPWLRPVPRPSRRSAPGLGAFDAASAGSDELSVGAMVAVNREAAGVPAGGSRHDELPLNATVVVDLLDCLATDATLLREEPGESRQRSLPFPRTPARHATLVWPLVAGWTDQPGLLATAMPRLAALGSRRVVPRALTFDARERHLLAERLQRTWPEAFDVVFHGDESPPDDAAFRNAAETAGLEQRLPRPLPAQPLPPRLRLARELAGHLIERGDAAATGADAWYRAARFLDRGEVDIEAAAREGNLGVLPWLEAPAKQAVEQWLAARRGV